MSFLRDIIYEHLIDPLKTYKQMRLKHPKITKHLKIYFLKPKLTTFESKLSTK